jgi:ammonia channel protein AmtB
MALIETLFYSINYIVILEHQYNVVDPGGSIAIHMFDAYFGLAVAWRLGKPAKEPEGLYTSDEFAFIGTLFYGSFGRPLLVEDWMRIPVNNNGPFRTQFYR